MIERISLRLHPPAPDHERHAALEVALLLGYDAVPWVVVLWRIDGTVRAERDGPPLAQGRRAWAIASMITPRRVAWSSGHGLARP